ncbi:MAG: tetratricopeptide repeat protein [Oculatellaceae cyanobacterium Prado106]|nr:tetratricopeptide repeat protein [Oculatellaceae cyanobacterium Prado106]
MISQLEAYRQQTFSSLRSPHRYPFYDSLGKFRDPATLRQREIAFYQKRIQENPQDGLDRASLAATYLGMAKVTGEGSWYLLAEQTAKQSLANLPFDNPGALSVLARLAEARHDFAGALKLAEQIPDEWEALAIRTTSHLAIGNLSSARAAADAWVDLTLSSQAFLMQAIVQVAQGEAGAIASFNHALEVEEAGEISTSARIRTVLGRFYYERGQLDLAHDLYQESLNILPNYPPALLNLAQLAIRQGGLNTATNYYDQLQALYPGNTSVYTPLILRGQARIKSIQGDATATELWQQAETLLRQSLVNPKFSNPDANPRSNLESNSGSNPGSNLESNSGFNSGSNPGSNSGANPGFNSESNSGSDPGSTLGHRRDLARLLLERGRTQDYPEALTLMEQEIKNRHDADTLNLYAWALLQTGQLTQAQTVIQKAIATGTQDPEILFRASQIEQALGHSQQSQNYVQQVLKIDPQFGDRARQAIGLGAGLGG